MPGEHSRADAVDGVILVAEDDAWLDFNLDILDARALGLGKLAHILLSSLDVLDCLRGDLRNAVLDLVVGQLEGLRGPSIEFLRVGSDCFIAVGPDVLDNSLNNLRDLLVGFHGRAQQRRLEMSGRSHGCGGTDLVHFRKCDAGQGCWRLG